MMASLVTNHKSIIIFKGHLVPHKILNLASLVPQLIRCQQVALTENPWFELYLQEGMLSVSWAWHISSNKVQILTMRLVPVSSLRPRTSSHLFLCQQSLTTATLSTSMSYSLGQSDLRDICVHHNVRMQPCHLFLICKGHQAMIQFQKG